MSEKFKNKYRIASHRRPGWDYSSNALYYITLVTQNRVCNLGEIVVETDEVNTDGRPYQRLSEFGKIVETEWLKSFEIRDELFLDEYIIMPNHLHAIVEIKKPDKMIDISPVDSHGRANLRESQSFYRLPKSISSFLAGFKSAVNSKIDDYIDQHQLNIPKYNRKNHFFQPNYHDHIIRDEQSHKRISDYIINNPVNWNKDKLKTV